MGAGNGKGIVENLPERGEWLSRIEFINATGVKERTLTNRIKGGYYKSRLNDKGDREVFLSDILKKELSQNVSGNTAGVDAGMSDMLPEENFRQHIGLPETGVYHIPVSVLGNAGKKCETCESLKGRISLLEAQLKSVEIAYAKLEGQIEGKEEVLTERDRVIESLKSTVEAKEQAVNATQAAYLNLQDQNIQLQNKNLPAIDAGKFESKKNTAAAWMFWRR